MLLLSTTDDVVTIPLRLLAARAGISVTQARRAIKRLIGVKLVEVVEPGRGRVAAKYRIRRRLLSFPQPFVPSSPAPLSQGSQKRAPTETTAPPKGAAWSDLPLKRPSSALCWAMFRLRREIQGWGLSPPRRENLLRGLGNAVWRAILRGWVRTTVQLRRLVTELIAQLQSAPEGVSVTLKRACGYAGAMVLLALRTLGLRPSPGSGGSSPPPPKIPSPEELARERQASARALEELLRREGARSLVELVRAKVQARGSLLASREGEKG